MRVGKRMNSRGLMIAGDHNARTFVCLKIFR